MYELNRAPKGGCYLVFTGTSEIKFLRAQQLEGAEQHAANEQDDGESKARMWKMVTLRWNSEREESVFDR